MRHKLYSNSIHVYWLLLCYFMSQPFDTLKLQQFVAMDKQHWVCAAFFTIISFDNVIRQALHVNNLLAALKSLKNYQSSVWGGNNNCINHGVQTVPGCSESYHGNIAASCNKSDKRTAWNQTSTESGKRTWSNIKLPRSIEWILLKKSFIHNDSFEQTSWKKNISPW